MLNIEIFWNSIITYLYFNLNIVSLNNQLFLYFLCGQYGDCRIQFMFICFVVSWRLEMIILYKAH
jgi:hypothetical protein